MNNSLEVRTFSVSCGAELFGASEAEKAKSIFEMNNKNSESSGRIASNLGLNVDEKSSSFVSDDSYMFKVNDEDSHDVLDKSFRKIRTEQNIFEEPKSYNDAGKKNNEDEVKEKKKKKKGTPKELQHLNRLLLGHVVWCSSAPSVRENPDVLFAKCVVLPSSSPSTFELKELPFEDQQSSRQTSSYRNLIDAADGNADEQNKDRFTAPQEDVYNMNWRVETKGTFEDVGLLPHTNVPCALDFICYRFRNNNFFTWISPMLLALKPPRDFGIYSQEQMDYFLIEKNVKSANNDNISYNNAYTYNMPSPFYINEEILSSSGSSFSCLPPHIYSICIKALLNLQKKKKKQNIILSGEASSGKTFTALQVLKFFLYRNELAFLHAQNTKKLRGINAAFDSSSILINAFGASESPSGQNSSKFVRYLKVYFCGNGADSCSNSDEYNSHNETLFVCGGEEILFLLEKERVICMNNCDRKQAEGENSSSNSIIDDEKNFNIFYYLVKGCNDEEKKLFKLRDAEFYALLKNDSIPTYHNTNYREELWKVKDAMKKIGLSHGIMKEVFKILSAILLLGNLRKHMENSKRNYYRRNDDEDRINDFLAARGGYEYDGSSQQTKQFSFFLNKDHKYIFMDICDLLNIPYEMLFRHLAFKNAATSLEEKKYEDVNELVEWSQEERKLLIESICKNLYEALFIFLRNRINQRLSPPPEANKRHFIGIFDMPSFEIFKLNSLEQFLKNIVNETLHQKFIHSICEAESELYTEEGLDMIECIYADGIDSDTILMLSGRLDDYSHTSNFDENKYKSFEECDSQNDPGSSSILKCIHNASLSSSSIENYTTDLVLANRINNIINAYRLKRHSTMGLNYGISNDMTDFKGQTRRNNNNNNNNNGGNVYDDYYNDSTGYEHAEEEQGDEHTCSSSGYNYNNESDNEESKKYEFKIYHANGETYYSTKGFMFKNCDALLHYTVRLFKNEFNVNSRGEGRHANSNNHESCGKLLRMLMEDVLCKNDQTENAQSEIFVKEQFVTSRFIKDFSIVLNSINGSEQYYISCIDPFAEDEKNRKQKDWSNTKVLMQLHNANVFEALYVRAQGYPYRRTFAEFIDQFGEADMDIVRRYKDDLRTGCLKLIERLLLDNDPATIEEGDEYKTGETFNSSSSSSPAGASTFVSAVSFSLRPSSSSFHAHYAIGKNFVFLKKHFLQFLVKRYREILYAWEPLVDVVKAMHLKLKYRKNIMRYMPSFIRLQSNIRRHISMGKHKDIYNEPNQDNVKKPINIIKKYGTFANTSGSSTNADINRCVRETSLPSPAGH